MGVPDPGRTALYLLVVTKPVVHVVALLYLEPYYSRTVECLSACGLPVTYVERHRGTGSLTAALNRGFANLNPPPGSFVWFTTDVEFDPEVPEKLARALQEDPGLAAIHPAHPSDHQSHRPDGSGVVKLVPYVEFTAPMWRADAFRDCGLLDEDHWYWYQDLVISKTARDMGYRLAVHHGAEVSHAYRGRQGEEIHPITKLRYDLRRYRDPVEQRLLERKYGPDWRAVLWAQ